MGQKLNALLAKAEHTGKQYVALVKDYLDTFAKKQGIFQGKRQVYTAAPGRDEHPHLTGFTAVQSTVRDYLAWFVSTVKEYINNRFSVEATNATGKKAPLIVEGVTWGEFTTLELMRLRDLLNNAELTKMYQTLPVRSDTKNWKLSADPEMSAKLIYETEVKTQVQRTTEKASIILTDPNLAQLKDTKSYVPQVVQTNTTITEGTFELQEYSGELSHLDRATMLRRITNLKASVQEALAVANEAPVVESKLTAEMIFGYIHDGKI